MSQKKIGVILGFLFLLILLLGFVSAQSCSIEERSSCSDYIVMGLSSQTNAHGELASEGNYDYVLCCDFGSGNTACDGTNKIIGLSDDTNAHAEIPEESTYTSEVCYENLNCTSNDGDCTSEYPISLLSLSADTNAHIGEFDEYSVKICCTEEGPITEEPEAYWANINDYRYSIISLEVVPEETQVAMVLKNAGLSINTEVIFEIYEDDLFGDDDIRTESNSISGSVNDDGNAIAQWTVTQSDLDKTFDLDEFYFIAEGETSGDLSITISDETCIGINYCSDYTDQTMCEEDTCGKAETSVEENNPEITCGEDYICGCSWDGTECGPKWTVDEVEPFCGDGNVDTGETCDGDDWGSITGCSDFGFTGEDLSCDSSCNFNTSLCTGGTEGDCGDGVINTGETCDGDNWGSITDCSYFDEFIASGPVLLSCDEESCTFDTSQCTGGTILDTPELGTCLFSEDTNDDCADGFLTYSWSANIDWPSDNTGWSSEQDCIDAEGDELSCVEFDDGWHYDPQVNGVNPLLTYCIDGGNTISCPAQSQLQFFGFYNMLVTLVVIALIYTLLILKVFNFKKRI